MKDLSSSQGGIYTYIGELNSNNQFQIDGTLIHPSGNIEQIAATDNDASYTQPDLSLDCCDVSTNLSNLLESIDIPEASNNGNTTFKLRLQQHANATDSDIQLDADSVQEFIQKITDKNYTDIELEDSACNAPITRFLLSDAGKKALTASNIKELKLTLSHSNLKGSYSSVKLKHDPTTGNSRPYLIGSQGNRKEPCKTIFSLKEGNLTISSDLRTKQRYSLQEDPATVTAQLQQQIGSSNIILLDSQDGKTSLDTQKLLHKSRQKIELGALHDQGKLARIITEGGVIVIDKNSATAKELLLFNDIEALTKFGQPGQISGLTDNPLTTPRHPHNICWHQNRLKHSWTRLCLT